jgi:hypothetical protein
MALTDPQKITISAAESKLPRVNTGNFSSTYENEDGTVRLTLSTQQSGRKRHVVRVDVEKITEDPFSGDNVPVSMSVYTVIDRPLAGYTNAEALAVFAGFTTLLTESSSSLVTKLLGSES